MVEHNVNFRLNIFRDRDDLPLLCESSLQIFYSRSWSAFRKTWQDVTSLKRGLVLVTGAIGVESTTISSLINHINLHRKTRIITLEDPVEFLFQRELYGFTKANCQDVDSFANGLRSALGKIQMLFLCEK